MNRFQAKLIEIKKSNHIQILQFQLQKQSLTLITLDTIENLKCSYQYSLAIKPINIAIARESKRLQSTMNQLCGTVMAIEFNELLCSITLQIDNIQLESIVLKESLKDMDLKVKDNIMILINISDITLC